MTTKAEEFKAQNAMEKDAPMREVDGKKEYLDEETNEWVSKNELKTRKTQRKKAKEAQEKLQKKKEAAPAKDVKKAAATTEDVEDLDPSKYTEIRKKFLDGLRSEGKNPYPHKFARDMTIPQLKEKYDDICVENGVFLEN